MISLTMLEIDSKDLITGIYIGRQLPYDEAERKVSTFIFALYQCTDTPHSIFIS